MALETIPKSTEWTALAQLWAPWRVVAVLWLPKHWFAHEWWNTQSATLWCICCNHVVSELKKLVQQRSDILSLFTTLLPKFSSVTNPDLVHCVHVRGAEVHFATMMYLWNYSRNMQGPALQRWCFSLSWGWGLYRFIHHALSSSVELLSPLVLGHWFEQATDCHKSWPIAPAAEISRPADYVPTLSQQRHKLCPHVEQRCSRGMTLLGYLHVCVYFPVLHLLQSAKH